MISESGYGGRESMIVRLLSRAVVIIDCFPTLPAPQLPLSADALRTDYRVYVRISPEGFLAGLRADFVRLWYEVPRQMVCDYTTFFFFF